MYNLFDSLYAFGQCRVACVKLNEESLLLTCGNDNSGFKRNQSSVVIPCGNWSRVYLQWHFLDLTCHSACTICLSEHMSSSYAVASQRIGTCLLWLGNFMYLYDGKFECAISGPNMERQSICWFINL